MVAIGVKKTLLIIMACVSVIAYATFLIGGAQLTPGASAIGENQMQQFFSHTELEQTLETMRSNTSNGWGGYDEGVVISQMGMGRSSSTLRTFSNGGLLESLSDTMVSMSSSGAKGTAGAAGTDSSVPGTYSQTNNQVVDVDEADIVKTDGNYIYYSAGQSIYILRAYPADQAGIVSEIEFDGDPYQIFVNDDKLVVFENASYYSYRQEYSTDSSFNGSLHVKVYDISDRANPALVRDISTDGNYVSSRMIGDYVYMVMNEYAFDYQSEQINLPQIKVDDDIVTVAATDIYYPDIIDSSGYGFTTIVAVNLSDDEQAPDYTSMLLGSSGVVYVSTDNIYITMQKYNPDGSLTQIHRFSVADGDVIYRACGEVPGWLLNQFSMDEYNGYFRVATTVGRVSRSWGGDISANNLYILDMNMDVVGQLTDMAPGEQIYSARFMGARAYVVTFKKVDPLFVIDLANPRRPRILGELKITGYSDYLHPYDENHLIGIGKEAIPAESGDFAWYQGVKVSLFDVSDVAHPVEIDKIEIGDRGTESPVLDDHKALLFDRELNMLVMPIMIAEVSNGDTSPRARGQRVWQGAYVLDISPEEGIELRGGITHYDEGFQTGHYNNNYNIQRSLYIDDVLYTMSNGKMKLNDLETLDYIDQVTLEDE